MGLFDTLKLVNFPHYAGRCQFDKKGHDAFKVIHLAAIRGFCKALLEMARNDYQAGFIERIPDADDQRISRVYLTEKGRAVRSQVDEVFRTLEEEMLAGFSQEEREQLLNLLQRVDENLRQRSCAEVPVMPEDTTTFVGEAVLPQEAAN